MYNDDDYISGIDGAEFGSFRFPRTQVRRNLAQLIQARRNRRLRRRHSVATVTARSAAFAPMGEDYSLTTPGGTLALTDSGLSFSKAAPAPAPSPSPATGGPLESVKAFAAKNPVLLAGLALGAVILLKTIAKKR